MGLDKFLLPIGDHPSAETILQRVVRRLGETVNTLAIVGNLSPATQSELTARHQHLELLFRADERVDHGPLEGIRVGLAALASTHRWAFVTASDAALLQPQVVDLLFRKLEAGRDGIVPVQGPRIFGMTAIYRTELHLLADQLIQANRLRVSTLASAANCQQLPVTEFGTVDPGLLSLVNLNRPEDYFRLLKQLGESCPDEIRRQLERDQSEDKDP